MQRIDPDQRYLLTRPRGGFNDQMVQLEKSRRYAARFGRILIIDVTLTGLRLGFDKVFQPSSNFGCKTLIWSESVGRELDKISSVFPPQLQGRVSTYVTQRDADFRQRSDTDSGCMINFDHQIDHKEHLLVYEQADGGLVSLCVLRRLQFTAPVANEIARRLIPLGPDYDALHIRHSDYRTEYQILCSNCRAMFLGRKLLVCTDNREVKNYAASCFHPTTELLSVANIPDLEGKPMYNCETLQPYEAAIDLLSDLIAMARSQTLVYTKFSTKYYGRIRCSGFSLLAENLKREPETIRHLFSNVQEDYAQALFSPLENSKHDTRGFRDLLANIRRWFGKLDQWRWNFRVCRNSRRRANRIRRNPQITEHIGPDFLG